MSLYNAVRCPLIYVLKRETGEVLSKKPFTPGQKCHADSDKLLAAFGARRLLGASLQPFDKTKSRFLCVAGDSLYVSDLGRSVVYKTSLQSGEIELAFGHYGKAKGQMNEPSGIHVDADGQAILVADSKNNRLQVGGGAVCTWFMHLYGT